ncbi:SDR family NAD(P)-dependent oxidoreductase [Streptomyces sp. NPDC058335]|uniref:SDR family NAD(P)-dependent oxidoreductase n=1 Tax=Streptomyces sp. NPDC058335 TaxID=3346451 RepID=UPI003646D8A1
MISGGSSGIGREIAVALARAGYRTALIARREERLHEVACDLSRWAPSIPISLDLSCSRAVYEELPEALRGLGPVDVLVNCAGHGQYKPFLECIPEDQHRLMGVHYFAAAAAIRALLPSMLERGDGSVINIGSMSVKVGPWGHSGYAAAKAALTALTEALAAEYGDSGVRFSIVYPGMINTPFFDHPSLDALRARNERFLIPPERVARAVTRLLDRPRLHVCVPRYYRLLDLLAAASPSAAHYLVTRCSRPRDLKASDIPKQR